MIVYNVKRRWFTMKAGAEAYRKAEGLAPAATFTLRIENREDLANLLNGLCGLEGIHRHVEVTGEVIPEPVLARNEIHTPDCVPRFLVEEWAAKDAGRYRV